MGKSIILSEEQKRMLQIDRDINNTINELFGFGQGDSAKMQKPLPVAVSGSKDKPGTLEWMEANAHKACPVIVYDVNSHKDYKAKKDAGFKSARATGKAYFILTPKDGDYKNAEAFTTLKAGEIDSAGRDQEVKDRIAKIRKMSETYFPNDNASIQDRALKLAKYYISLGLPPIVAAALMGNLMVESGIDPYKLEVAQADNGKIVGEGLAQWTYYSRKEGFVNRYGHQITDPSIKPNKLYNEQVEYLWITDGFQNFANTQISLPQNIDYNNQFGTLNELTETICTKFEKPGVKHLDWRKRDAQKIYMLLGLYKVDPQYMPSLKNFQSVHGLRADGVIGPKTYPVICKFQEENKLKVDGMWGPNTSNTWDNVRENTHIFSQFEKEK